MRKSRCFEIGGGLTCVIAAIVIVIVSGIQDPYKPTS